MLPKVVIIVGLIGVIAALGFALYYLMNDRSNKKRTATALAIRVSISIAIILFLLIGNYLGWIQPHGIYG